MDEEVREVEESVKWRCFKKQRERLEGVRWYGPPKPPPGKTFEQRLKREREEDPFAEPEGEREEFKLSLHAGWFDEARCRALVAEHGPYEAGQILEREGPGESPATNGTEPDATDDAALYEFNRKIFEAAEWIDEPGGTKQITPRGFRWRAMVDCEMRRLRAFAPYGKGQCDAACDFLIAMPGDERDTRSYLMMTSTAFVDARYHGPSFATYLTRDTPTFTQSTSRTEWGEFDLAYQYEVELDDLEHVAARWFWLVERKTGEVIHEFVTRTGREPNYSVALGHAQRELLEDYCGPDVPRRAHVARWMIEKLVSAMAVCPRCNGKPHRTDPEQRAAFDQKWTGAKRFRNTFERQCEANAAAFATKCRAKWDAEAGQTSGGSRWTNGQSNFERATSDAPQEEVLKGPEWSEPELLTAPLPDVFDFTDDLFPDSLRKWAKQIAENTGTTKAFVWSALMVALSSVIGRRLGIRPKRYDTNWLVVPNLWGMVIGRPGSMKSPPVEIVLRPLRSLAHAAMKEWQAAMRTYEVEFREWKADKSKDKGPPPMRPIAKRYLLNNFTTEKLGDILMENPQGVLIERDELIGLLRGLERKGYEHARGFMLETWNGNSSGLFDTIGRGTVYVPAMCVSLMGTMSPGPLTAYLAEAFAEDRSDDGFMQRFQLAVWPDPARSALGKDRPRDDTDYRQAREVFRKLDELNPEEFGAVMPDKDDARGVPYVGFADEKAQTIFNDYLVELDQKMFEIEEADALKSHFAKYRSLMPSLALIYYAVDRVGGWIEPGGVRAEDAASARRACKILASHARRIYSPLARQRPSERGADMLYRKLLKREIEGPIKPRDLQQKMKSVFKDVETVEAAISKLVKRGVLASRLVDTGARRGAQVTKVWDVNPRIFEVNRKGREPGQEG